jgi:hypothetical protein
LSSHPREREKLLLMALSMTGPRYLPHIPHLQKRLHKNRVDTIFKYNKRGMKEEYIATMTGTRKWSTA